MSSSSNTEPENQGLFIDPIAKAKEMNKQPKIARFYKEAHVGENDGVFSLLLDGKKAKTPKRKGIAIAQRAIAEELANEWNAQEEYIQPHIMPFTRMVNVAIDMDENSAKALSAQLFDYLEFDSALFMHPHPKELITLQEQRLEPIFSWIKTEFNEEPVLTKGFSPPKQPERLQKVFQNKLSMFTPLELVCMHSLISISASVMIGFYQHAHLHEIETPWSAAHVENDWNIKQWGEDEEAEFKRKINRRDWEAATVILRHHSA